MAPKNSEKNQIDPRNEMIAKRMIELRQKAGYSSKEDFSSDFNIGRMSYWRAESGTTNITMKLLYQVIDAHNMSLAEFFAPLTDKK